MITAEEILQNRVQTRLFNSLALWPYLVGQTEPHTILELLHRSSTYLLVLDLVSSLSLTIQYSISSRYREVIVNMLLHMLFSNHSTFLPDFEIKFYQHNIHLRGLKLYFHNSQNTHSIHSSLTCCCHFLKKFSCRSEKCKEILSCCKNRQTDNNCNN